MLEGLMAMLVDKIDETVGEVRTESLDLSFGEIINLHESRELIIRPEYQRLFRWSPEQKSRLIESVLVELPIPQIFVIENQDGVLELIDGLQRVSTLIQFVQPELIDAEPLELEGCDLIQELNGLKYGDLPTTLKLRLKRSSVRTVIIKRQSKSMLRYEMFKRLNTGGSLLSSQEIRNVSSRMVGDSGVEFYLFLQQLAAREDFKVCIQTLSDSEREKRGDEELVLRFFATKNARESFRGSVQEWLDGYMEDIVLGRVDFPYEEEAAEFDAVFSLLASSLGAGAFVRYRNGQPIGGLAPAYFEAVAGGTSMAVEALGEAPDEVLRDAVIETVQSEGFRDVTGPGANSKQKLEGRVELVLSAIEARLGGGRC